MSSLVGSGVKRRLAVRLLVAAVNHVVRLLTALEAGI